MVSTFYSLDNPRQDRFQIAGRQFVLDAGPLGYGIVLGPAIASLDTGEFLNLEVENERPFLLRLGANPFGFHHVVLHFGCGLKKVVVAGQTLELGASESVEAALPASIYGQGLATLRREGCGVVLEIIGAPDPEETDPHPVPVEIPLTPYGQNCKTESDCENGGAVDAPSASSSGAGDALPDLRASWFPGSGNDGVSPGPISWDATGSAAEAVTLDSLSIPGAPDSILPGTVYLPPKTHATNGSRLQYRTQTGLFEATSDDDVLTLRFFPAPTSTTPTLDWDEDAQQTPDFIATIPVDAIRTITYTRSGDDIAVAVDGRPTHLLGININGTTKTTSWQDLINGRKTTIIRRDTTLPEVETLDYEDHGGLTLVSRTTRVFKPEAAAADGHVLVSLRQHATATGTDAADEVETLDYDISTNPTFVTRRVSNGGGWSVHRKGGTTFDGPELPMMQAPGEADLTSWSLTARPWLDADPPAAASGETAAEDPNPQESVIELTREWSDGSTTSETFTTGIPTARSLTVKDTTTVDSTTFNRTTQTVWSSSGASTSTERLSFAEGDWKDRIFRNIAADGGTMTYNYAKGQDGEIITTATEGTITSPEGINGKTTRVVSTSEANGLPLIETTTIRTGGSYATATTTEWEYEKDATGKVTATTIRRDGRVIETTSTLGQTTTRTGEDGVTTIEVTSASGNLLTSTLQGYGASPDRVTTWLRDGPTTTVTRSAAGESPLVSSSTVNLLGQTISSTDEAGTVTTYSRSIDGETRTTETSTTNGVTRSTTRHRDGKFHSSGGNGQIPRRATYAIGSNGFLLTTESTGPVVGETAHSHRWTSTLTDWSGRIIEHRQPAPPEGIGTAGPGTAQVIAQYAYDNAGRLTAVTDNTGAAPRLTFHDSPGHGDTTSGLDIDNDQQFTPGTDRYSINTSTYIDENGSWWRQNTTETPITGTTPLTVSSKSSLNVAAGETSIRTDAAGAVSTTTTVFTPEERSTVTNTETPDGTSTSTTSNGLVTSTTVPSTNRASALVYDGHGRIKRATDHRGSTNWYGYDNAGRLATVTDHTGRVTTTVYYPANHTNAGLPWKTIAPGGAETITTYDEAGGVTAIGGNAVYAREHGYDEYGDIETLVTHGTAPATTTWVRDPGTGLVMRKVHHDNKETQYAWDMAGRLHQRQWARGITNTWTHDPATGDLTGLSHSDDTFDVTYSGQDVFGRPGSVTESRNGIPTTTTLEYNHFSGSLTETYPSNHPYLPNLKVEARADDQRGRPTGHIVKNDGTSIHGWNIGYDTLGRVGTLEGHNLTATIAYHPGTNRLATQTTHPNAGGNPPILTRQTNIDLLGRTYGVIHTAPDPDSGNTPRIVTALAHAHDIQGRRKSARREDGTIWKYEYNTRSEVTGAVKRQSNSDLVPGLDFGYNYDGLGNRLSASKGTPALVTEYEPDTMNRYASITSPGADDILVRSDTAVEVEVDEEPVLVTTSGDFRGARVTANNTTGPAFPEVSITGDNNFSESGHRWISRVEFSPTYDDDGNLTNDGRWIYTWDAMNRLSGLTPTAAALTAGVLNQSLSFAYDHLGRRIAKKVTTTTGEGASIRDYRYLYEGWNVVAQFTADTSNTLTPDATYLWSLDLSGTIHGAGGVGGLHSVNLLSSVSQSSACLACYDANGNIIAWTDSTGRLLQRQDYDPFGNRVIRERLAITPEQSNRLEYGFSTKPLDAETGLVYYINRYYNPRHGRWMSRDPIEEAGGLNLYGFLQNQPSMQYDILGNAPANYPAKIAEWPHEYLGCGMFAQVRFNSRSYNFQQNEITTALEGFKTIKGMDGEVCYKMDISGKTLTIEELSSSVSKTRDFDYFYLWAHGIAGNHPKAVMTMK